MLAFDGDSAGHVYSLAPFLYDTLGIRVVVSALELPLVLADDFAEMMSQFYDLHSARHANGGLYRSTQFPWHATSLLEGSGMSVKLLRTFYQSVDEAWCFGEQSTPPRAPATGYELGVLVPGHPWRKGVPLGRHTQAVGGGMVIEDYSEPDQDLTARVAAVLVVEEHEVPCRRSSDPRAPALAPRLRVNPP